MSKDIVSTRATYVAPSFSANDDVPLDPALDQRIRRPIRVGSAVIAALVVGLGLWASVTQIDSGVTAVGELRSEGNRKTLRSKEGGVVRAILVKEGQTVRAGQPLLVFDDVQPKSVVDVLQGQYDSALVTNARFAAEATGRTTLELPAELTARMNEPRVAAVIRDQQFLFQSRQQTVQGQLSILSQREQQLGSTISGLQAQLDALEERRRLTTEQLDGYKTLEAKGFASKNLVRQFEATLADISGRKGALLSEIARTRQQIGEARMQQASLMNDRQSQAAEGVRAAQAMLAEVGPKLTAVRQTLAATTIRAPVDGYVLGLSQFTVGGVAGAGEVLMEVVPANAPLVVTAEIKPGDIEAVHAGMIARVRLDALNQRWVSPLQAKVISVSADRLVNQQNGHAFYRADLRIDPEEIRKLPKTVTLTAGMPASVLVVTGKRPVMSYLISPIKDTFEDAFREQ